MTGTAVPARRFLLVEVPGAWPRAATTRLGGVGEELVDRASAAATRLLLIRRPGRDEVVERRPRAWALADTTTAVVRWDTYVDPTDLLAIDPARRLTAQDAVGPQHVALVCTHGSRDVCCAVRGRPVAAALARRPGVDTWECTHVGGDRFAGNVVVLPSGDMFGRVDDTDAGRLVEDLWRGRVDLRHHRGQVGHTPVEQAAAHLVAVALDDDRHGAVQVRGVSDVRDAGPDGRQQITATVERDGVIYDVTLIAESATPARLSCSSPLPARARRFALDTLAPRTSS